MNNTRIDELIEKYKLPAFRKKQLTKAIFNDYCSSFQDITTLPLSLRNNLTEEVFLTVKQVKLYKSNNKRCYKVLLSLQDGKIIESVLMNTVGSLWTTCISSQVGCALKCTFCATGKMGLLRNLTSEEITDQVLFWLIYIKENLPSVKLQNVVYMGMGEPFHNLENTLTSITNLKQQFNIGSRHISVSTSGLKEGIIELAKRHPQVNLAISLHAPNNNLRTELMPINNKYSLETLLDSIKTYLSLTNRKIFFEYILLDDCNDDIKHAEELIEYLKPIAKKLIHINLIVYNKTSSSHQESSQYKANKFQEYLQEKKFSVTIRKNLGRDIEGACGQLATTM